MLIKRFEGPTMQDVVRQVRMAMGPDAMVLSQRTRREGGFLGRGGALVVEVTAAVDREQIQPRPSDEDRTRSDVSWKPLQLTRALIEPLEDEIRDLRRVVEESGLERTGTALSDQIRELKELARDFEKREGTPAPDDGAACFLRAGLRLDVSESLAGEVALRVRDGEREDSARVDALARSLEERFALPRPDVARSQLVIGAPGVGKTSTLAKLVDRYAAHGPTLVSADTGRRGGSARLRGAASQLGVPFEELDPANGLSRLRHKPLFVDTPGLVTRAPSARSGLEKLRGELGGRADVQLVVAATTKEADLHAQLSAAERCEPTSLVVTRVDETQDLASVVNLILRPGAPRLAWLGCGEVIPTDLELPDAHALARSVLGESA